MIRIILVILLFSPCLTRAQYSQSDPWEKIEVPVSKEDFTSILNFWKQFNSIQIKELLKLDSILFYKNDTLKYTYYIADLKFFQANMKLADSAIQASTDSVYNKEKNSYDTYFTDIEKNRYLDNRKYLNENKKYYKAEQFSEDAVVVLTNWQYDKDNHVVKETNEFLSDSAIYIMSYQRNGIQILKRQAEVNRKGLRYSYNIEYNNQGGITGYSYEDISNKSRRGNERIKIVRDRSNRTQKIDGTFDNKPVVFSFSYSENTISIVKQISSSKTVFKLVTF